MSKTDHRINEHGVDVTELKVGQWIELSWRDADNEPALIIGVEERSKTYKGERSLRTLVKDRKDVWYVQSADSSQIVRIIQQKLQVPGAEVAAVTNRILSKLENYGKQ